MDDYALDLKRPPVAWSDADWEAAWAPYDAATYAAALAFICPDDVVLDIGAGDLRFARRVAQRARAVWAIERRSDVVTAGIRSSLPRNLSVICGDALRVSLPPGVTVAVLLMRHCRHFGQYVGRLRNAGCERLITNARWGMDVECMPLMNRLPYAATPPGWYACDCGSIGFLASPDTLTPVALSRVTEVTGCPACAP